MIVFRRAFLAICLPVTLIACGTNAIADDLRPMLEIAWRRAADPPQGLQDSDGGVLGGKLISVCGYCSGNRDEQQRKPGRYPAGFLKRVMAFDLGAESSGWSDVPEFPGLPRQGVFCARANQRLCVWGGFSYSQPFCFSDGWALSKRDAGWKWEQLPPLPWPLTSAGACAIETKVYVCGGAQYDIQSGFHTQIAPAGKVEQLGSRLLMLDTAHLDVGWKRLADCPGTPRFVHTVQAVAGKVYVIGGATGGSPTRTVVDNWRFDPDRAEWSRIRDLPISSGNFPKSSNLVFDDRFIILVGGYQYGDVANPDGTHRPNYGTPSHHDTRSGLNNDVFVYDTQTNQFGTADKLPVDNNLPMTVVHGDEIFVLGGETGGVMLEGEFYGNHPDLLLRGKIERLP
jgi:N-acetylneuraminic acid mutarotase